MLFFYLSKLLFLGFLYFKGDFERDQNNRNNRDRVLLIDVQALIISRSLSRYKVTCVPFRLLLKAVVKDTVTSVFFPEYIFWSVVV